MSRSLNGLANDMNIRTMSGIPESTGGDVFLAGNPNTFTGTNTFNVNRPTSTLSGTPASDDFITKSDADALYTGAGSSQRITDFTHNATNGNLEIVQATTGTPITTVTLSGITITTAEKSAIASNTSAIATNTTAIASNTANITANATDIASNTANITANATAITSNTNAIASNTNNIASNTANITANATAITSNTTNITANATAIDDCINNVSIAGQVLTFTQHDTTTIPITIPSSSLAKFYFSQSLTNSQSFNVSQGNPSVANPNLRGGWLAGSTLGSNLIFSGVNGNATGVKLDFSIAGEWQSLEYDKGVLILKAESSQQAGGYIPTELLCGPTPTTSSPLNVRCISPFQLGHNNNNTGSTMESCNGIYVDTQLTNGKFYQYSIILVNSATSTALFSLNRTFFSTPAPQFEMGVSVITGQEFYN